MKLSDLRANFQTCHSLDVLAIKGPGNVLSRWKNTLYNRILVHSAAEYDPTSSVVSITACVASSGENFHRARQVKIGKATDNFNN